MKRSNSGNIVLIVLILAAIGFFIYLLVKPSIKSILNVIPVQTSAPTEKPLTTISPSANPIFQSVKEFIEDKTQPDNILVSEKSYVWWLSSDGYNIINNNTYGIESQFSCTDYKASRFDSSLKTLAPIFPNFIKQNGFSENSLNTSKSLTDDKFYDYVQAYEKNGLKCVLTASPDCSGIGDGSMWQTISFSCTSDFDKNYAIQAPILKDLGIKDAIVSISKQVGNFAEIQVHYRRTGHYVIAVQEGGVWKELYSGQDIPSCSMMTQYNVPKEIYENCF